MSAPEQPTEPQTDLEAHPVQYQVVPRGRPLSPLEAARKQHEHNMDLTTEEGRLALMATNRRADYSGQRVPDGPLPVKWWRIHEAYGDDYDEDSQYGPYRMVLVTTDGRTLATFSRPAQEALALAVDVYGRAEWDPPIMVSVTKEPTLQGRQYLQLDFRGRQSKAPDQKGGKR